MNSLPYEIVSLIYEYDGRYSKLKQYFYEIVLQSVRYIGDLKNEIQELQLQIERYLKREDRLYFASKINWKRIKHNSKHIKECRNDINELLCELNSISDKTTLLKNTYGYLYRTKFGNNHFSTKEYDLWLKFGYRASVIMDNYNKFIYDRYYISSRK